MPCNVDRVSFTVKELLLTAVAAVVVAVARVVSLPAFLSTRSALVQPVVAELVASYHHGKRESSLHVRQCPYELHYCRL